ncbi:hypothetical protein SUGI_0753390 [Cryptomeria japonica]|uniref:small ribosomal subunit protein uS7m n=1 Tax=Cryptomeria japonica TaxID=3369 RepID=UPI0024149485|nr:small ribosomal subunit protein uS7m [Cryptomeria japonica]XP_059065423.1 small ribosomal subunit protein uS7m [Cryptomeria japonica]GLJ37151.1 hypothetical protein SUGI_0753390 [Cryptomeria japonica]
MASSSSVFRTGLSSVWRYSTTHHISATACNEIFKVQCCSLHNKRRGSPAYSEILSYIGGYSDPGLEQKQLIDKFINFCTSNGEKTRARVIAYQALHRLAQTDSATKLLVNAVGNIKPVCEVSKVRVAGATYQVPDIVDRDRQQTLALRWLLEAALKRRTSNKIGLDQCLSAEVLDAYRKKGIARKKRDDLHELASNNRSFVHFRWW